MCIHKVSRQVLKESKTVSIISDSQRGKEYFYIIATNANGNKSAIHSSRLNDGIKTFNSLNEARDLIVKYNKNAKINYEKYEVKHAV